MNKIYFTLLLVIISQIDLFGQTFTVGGINYKITSTSPAEVAVAPHTSFTGVANIPSTVTNASVTYDVKSIGDSAFYNCTGLTSVNIPNSILSIGNFSFYTCTGLTTVDIPNSVTSIGSNAFFICNALSSINIPSSVTFIDQAAFGLTALTSVTLPNSITAIANHTFYNCVSLASVSIPSSVTSIGNFAFYGCGLTSVTVDWSNPLIIAPQVFEAVTLSGVTLIVPAGTTSLYQSTAVWEDFGFFTSLGLEESVSEHIQLNVYPNPVSSYFSINTTNDLNNMFEYSISDLSGTIVLKGNSAYNQPINLIGLTNGNYIIQIETDQGDKAIEKLIKL